MIYLFQKIFEFFASLPPFVIINDNEGAVRLRFGRYTKTLRPGLHWRIPLVHTVIACLIKDQVVDVPSQVVGDVSLEATIRYEIEDPQKALLECLDYDESIVNLCSGLIGEHMIAQPGISAQELSSSVLDELAGEAEDWGISVTDFKITTFAKCRVFRLLGMQ